MDTFNQFTKSTKSPSAYITVLTLLLTLCNGLCAQQTVIDWEENLGGSSAEEAHVIEQTNDGGYIVAGESESSDGDVEGNQGGLDYWIVKLNPTGQIEWRKNLGGSDHEEASDIEQINDGGYIVAGHSESSDGDVGGNQDQTDCWIVKLNQSGQLEWEENFGGSYDDHANDIEQTNDGGYIIAGYSESSDGDVGGNKGDGYWVIKLNQAGQLEWEESLGGTGLDLANDVEQTNDGGYIIAGYSYSSNGDVGGNQGEEDYWIVKLNQSGQLVWEENLGGSDYDRAKDIEQTNDGGYILAGESESSDGDVGANQGKEDYWIVKLNQSGQLVWEENLGGTGYDIANDIEQTNDGGYIITGYSESSDGNVGGNKGEMDNWIVKLNQSGQLEWEENLGGSNNDYANDIEQTNDGGYIVAGGSESSDGDVGENQGSQDYWIVKFDREFNLGPDTTICRDDSLTLGPIQFPADSIGWSTGDTGDSIVVNDSGIYHVTVKTDSNTYSDTVEVATAPRPQVYIGPNEQAFCGKIDHTFNPETKHANTFQWNTGDTTKTLHVDQEGTYWLRVESEGACANADTSEIQALQTPKGFTNEQVAVCEGEVELDAGNPEASFEWSTGQTARKISVDKEGTYTVKIANDYCTIKDTIEVQLNEKSACPYLYIPNAFTPDGDGLNDVFKPGYQNIRNFRMAIYNRWGEQVFETNDITEGWDGTYQGSKVPEGQYLYNIVYHYKEKGFIRTNTKSGILQVVK